MTGLVSGIVEDVERLAEQQFALLRQEVKDEMKKAIAAGQMFVIGAVFAALAGIALMTAISLGLYAAIPSLPMWGAFGIVGLVFAIISGALLLLGKNQAAHVHAVPPLSLQASKENLQCLTPARK